MSLPDLLIWDENLNTRNEIHCKYMLALGYAGLGDMEHSLRYRDEAMSLNVNHQGIRALETILKSF